MKTLNRATVFTLFLLNISTFAYSEQTWVENTDGDLKPNEYRVVDPKGAVTRSKCPYT